MKTYLPKVNLNERQWHVVDAFFAAARDGDFEALVAVLDPDVVVRTDLGAARAGALRVVCGATTVAEGAITFAWRARFVRPALVNGAAGVVVVDPRGRPLAVVGFTVRRAKIAEINVLVEPARFRQLDLPFSTTDGSRS